MNCDDFLLRMHECIDERLPLDSDMQLQQHVNECDSCHHQWTAWTQISSVVMSSVAAAHPVIDQPFARQRMFPTSISRLGLGLAVAAAIMVVMFANQPTGTHPVHESPLYHASSVTGIASTIPKNTSTEAAAWWYEVQQRDWLAQTMPTVRRVRDGVAPLGRSILQAVAILTVGSGERAS